jgi:hypothetical protein
VLFSHEVLNMGEYRLVLAMFFHGIPRWFANRVGATPKHRPVVKILQAPGQVPAEKTCSTRAAVRAAKCAPCAAPSACVDVRVLAGGSRAHLTGVSHAKRTLSRQLDVSRRQIRRAGPRATRVHGTSAPHPADAGRRPGMSAEPRS